VRWHQQPPVHMEAGGMPPNGDKHGCSSASWAAAKSNHVLAQVLNTEHWHNIRPQAPKHWKESVWQVPLHGSSVTTR